MTKGRRTVTGPLAPSSIVISADELNRIRNGSVIKTEAEIAADKEHAERLKEEREKLSKERKDRMKELEKRSVMLAKKSDVEIAEIARNKAIRNMAEKKLDENADVVKLLNSMAQRATAFTIRDQQLEEKERLAKLEKEYDERLDVMIEIDRVQDIMKRENEEQYRKTKRVEDRKVINEQIAARERMRMLSLEAREQENQAMRNMMKRYEDEDRTQAAARAIEMEKSRKAVLLANADAIERKKQAREMEKKEMEDILIYQALKDQELARREEEEEAIARSKKERQAKLLAQQEKAQNNAGKMDELRARRAAEEKERNERKKEKAEALKRKQEMKILLESRAKQAADKLERQHSAKLQADEAVLMDMEYTRKMDERERREKAIKEARMEEHRVQLHAQIDERERRRRQTPEDNSGNIREELIREEAKLAVIRDQMVKDLVAQGVNPKYLSEMRNVDIGKILKR
eukprot:CAMPEP_0184975840 /NCGR_PEP_ID=MMETSP1098-20130426/6939_1 /TAXON_ID=89044 /ORGANISM="Spumella elongata, Strain CCAP 955/1" /LENGTH=461 /DNA_ID=CAMNT_0027498615 /DNA_START=99 /DNA_END=1484 /DNA_ORIENTATION=+